MVRRLRLVDLYPDVLNIAGDRGNLMAAARRAQWHGLQADVERLSLGDPRADLRDADLLFFGGGQDREQEIVARDLALGKGQALVEAAADGLVVLGICGGYQLMGHQYYLPGGQALEGLGILDVSTRGDTPRFMGNLLMECDLDGERQVLVGFENHGGRTELGPQAQPMGRVLAGNGNNGKDRTEGARWRNVFGTYLHGPLLPRNPVFADYLLKLALIRRYGEADLLPTPRPDEEEAAAFHVAEARARAS